MIKNVFITGIAIVVFSNSVPQRNETVALVSGMQKKVKHAQTQFSGFPNFEHLGVIDVSPK